MKKSIVILLLLLVSAWLLANTGPHPVVIGLKMVDGGAPTGETPEVVSFTADLYRSGATVGVQVSQSTFDCFYQLVSGDGIIQIDIAKCISEWQFGDILKINASCSSQTGQAQVVIGSFGDNRDEAPIGQGIQLLAVTPVTCTTTGVEVTQGLDYGDFALTPTGTGTVNVSAPVDDFTSIPGVARVDNIDQCFSVDFSSGITQLATSFSWASTDISGSMSDKDLLVSVDGVNWIYSDNSASGITGDVDWDFDDTPDPDEMTVSFTTTQDNALYAVSNGTDPDVTTPKAPAGGTASKNGSYVTISCRAVAVPGATYQAYSSPDFSTWTPITANYGGGTISQTITPNDMTGNSVMYYGLKAYNNNDTYLSGIGSTIYTYQKHTFETDTGNMTNLIPIPFDGFNNYFDDARLLGIQLGSNCNCIAKWDAATQRYSYCTQYAGAWRGNFDLEPDGVYFVNLTGAVAAKIYDGKMNTSDFELKTGVNLIYVSALDANLTNASDLMSDIGAHCTKVQQWDAANQEWKTHDSSREDFSLSKLNPVFVYVDADVAYEK